MSAWVAEAMAKGCGALPRDAERELMAAARRGSPESPERQRAIERAYARTGNMYPQLFKE